MKKYIIPKLQLILLSYQDIITTSGKDDTEGDGFAEDIFDKTDNIYDKNV